jgi:hypothetical protein
VSQVCPEGASGPGIFLNRVKAGDADCHFLRPVPRLSNRLLEESWLRVDGISGTSAGAMNAVGGGRHEHGFRIARQPARDRSAVRRGGTQGEKLAAEAALGRIRARIADVEHKSPATEMQFSILDPWSRHLFMALCRRYGLKPYRYHRQRRSTVVLGAPRSVIDQLLWREFSHRDADLQTYLHEVTMKIIREEVFADASDADEVTGALPPT